MKISHIQVSGLRALRTFEHSFTDEDGAARPVILFVGPSGCGKTSLLDAISLALGPAMGFEVRRPDLRFNARELLHPEVNNAVVEMELQFTASEIGRIGQVTYEPPNESASFRWMWPDPQGEFEWGRVDADYATLKALQAKRDVLRAIKEGIPGAHDLAPQLGRATLFDQHRKLLGEVLPKQTAWAIGAEPDDRGRVTHPRDLAVALWLKSQQVGLGAARAHSQWAAFAAAFNRTCAPRRLVGVTLHEDETYDIDIQTDATAGLRYGWEGLSAGERSVFPVLLRAAKEHLNHSIVMVDEVELHLHPAWQRRFLQALRLVGEDNQLILTTHSEYLRGAVPSDAVIDLGALTEPDDGAAGAPA